MMVIHHGALPFLFCLCLQSKGLPHRGAKALWLGMSLWRCFVFWGLLPAQSFCPYSALKRETPSPMNFPPIPKPTKLNTRRAVSKPLNTAPRL